MSSRRLVTSPTWLGGLVVFVLAGCSDKPKTFKTKVTIDHVQALGSGDAPALLDMELSYTDCPGKNLAVVRGDKAFAQCARGMKAGDAVDAELRFSYSSERSQYRSEITKLGSCERKPDPKDDATYDLVSDCKDVTVHGVPMGVHCEKGRSPELVAKCPWFMRK